MLGFLYTVYEQLDETEYSISILRDSKIDQIKNAKIIIVSTSNQNVGFHDLALKNNCLFINFINAPGDNTEWKSKFCPYGPIKPPSLAPCFQIGENPPGGLWRYNWLSMRILLSMELGIQIAKTLGISGLLHFHSDSYWKNNHENIISDYNNLLNNNYLCITDIAQQQENNILPKGMRFCPESLFFNINECYKFNYGFSFSDIYTNKNYNGNLVDNKEFFCQDYCASEALLGQYAYYCLTKNNILNNNDVLDDIWYQKIKIRQFRNHHGCFDNGFCNIEKIQEMKN